MIFMKFQYFVWSNGMTQIEEIKQKKIFLMKFNSMIFNKTALHVAVENENTDIINLLLSQEDINTNILSILNHDFFFISFQ